jgi:hypothetical protein
VDVVRARFTFAMDTPRDCTEVYATEAELVAACSAKGSAVSVTSVIQFLDNPAFSWRRHVRWIDLDPAARHAVVPILTGGEAALSPIEIQNLASEFDRGRPIGLFSETLSFSSPAVGDHWVKDSDAARHRWFCKICYQPEIANLAVVMPPDSSGFADHILNSISVRTDCDATLHNGIYAHQQRQRMRTEAASQPPRTDSTANDIAIMTAAIKESLTTISTFGQLMQTLTDKVESLSLQVKKQSQDK